ncbi:hypothetical protein [Streptomyces arboris]|uniref:hypothetical protein n=1 Tax=Streptomyces arboris TaxID=2600619 RepID=UPI003BF59E00
MSGTNAGIGSGGGQATAVDPAPCNAIVEGPSGLLVPATALAGVSGAGAAVGAERSVDIDVVAPAGTDCPREWQVGARLTPPYDQTLLENPVSLVTAAEGDWIALALALTLPEAGVYEVSATVNTVITVTAASGAYNIAILGRLYNVTAGGAIPGSQYTLQRNSDTAAPTSTKSDADVGTFHRFVPVAGPTVVRVEAAILKPAGTPGGSTGVLTGNTRLAYKKISD